MRYRTYVLKRVTTAVLTVYLVVTAMVVAMTPVVSDFVRGQIAEINRLYQTNDITDLQRRRLIESVKETYGYEKPLGERLLDWWTGLPTLQWGDSVLYQEPVPAVLDARLLRTLEYVLPALVLAVVLGVVLGTALAVLEDGRLDWSVRLAVYALFGIPVFMLVLYLELAAGRTLTLLGFGVGLPDPGASTLATLGVTASLLAAQVRFARASAIELQHEPFVTTLLAKGAGRLRLGRHLVRNLAIPILSLSIAELLGTLVLAIYAVEVALGIDGLGAVTIRAATEADLPLVVGATLLVVVVGAVLSLLQDLLTGYLDPRIGTG